MGNRSETIKRAAVLVSAFLVGISVFTVTAKAQDLQEPMPGPQRPIVVPKVQEKVLPNGLRIVVVERRNSPLVTVRMSFSAGAEQESLKQAGLADMTVSMLSKGTKARTAPQISSGIEFLGGSLDSGANWVSADVTLGVPSYNLAKAFEIFGDVLNEPVFDQKELELLKSQALDGLSSNLRQPSYLGNFAASVYSFYEHPVSGTPSSIGGINRDDLTQFRKEYFTANRATIVFVGDVTFESAQALTERYFGKWSRGEKVVPDPPSPMGKKESAVVKRILVIDLPNTGQASVSFVKMIGVGRTSFASSESKGQSSRLFYPAQVLNAVLGGGYSSRLNQEIRIKRGLSYGASSSFAWRVNSTNFSARSQTKNESAAEVAELTVAEVNRLMNSDVADAELKARKAVLTGSFGQALETNSGVASQLSVLYSLGLDFGEMNSYVNSIGGVGSAPVRDYATRLLIGGDLIIVGDYGVFGGDLAKRFPGVQVKVVKASELDLEKLR